VQLAGVRVTCPCGTSRHNEPEAFYSGVSLPMSNIARVR
jgi:hypothetical protein